MRITESQLRKIVRQEVLREADLRGATFMRGPDGKWVPSGGSDWEGAGAAAASRMRAGRPALPSRMSPDDAAEAILASLGEAGAEELVDAMYAATGPSAREAEARFTDALRDIGAGPLADDGDWSSEAYAALTDLVNPWDARR